MIVHFPTRASQFRDETGAQLPLSVQDFHSTFHRYDYWGNGVNNFYFRCDSGSIDTLVKAMQLHEHKPEDPDVKFPHEPNWPDAQKWPGLRIFDRFDQAKLTFYTLLTDKDGTQVYVTIDSI